MTVLVTRPKIVWNKGFVVSVSNLVYAFASCAVPIKSLFFFFIFIG